MHSEPILLTPRAHLFRSLSYDIRVINQRPIATVEERELWYAEVQRFREKLYSTYKGIYDDLPYELEHYLDDADIRAKDAGYRSCRKTLLCSSWASLQQRSRKVALKKRNHARPYTTDIATLWLGE